MRSEFQRKLVRRPDLRHRMAWVPGDAASFQLGHALPAAFLSGSFDRFVDGEERLASLRNPRRHLAPGGTLVFGVFLGLMGDSPLAPAGRVQRAGVDYRRLVGRRTLPEQKVEVRLLIDVYQRGVLVDQIEEVSLLEAVDREEVHGVLREAGFSVRREFSDHGSSPTHDGDRRLIVDGPC